MYKKEEPSVRMALSMSMHFRETIPDNPSLTTLSHGCRRRYETRTRYTRAFSVLIDTNHLIGL